MKIQQFFQDGDGQYSATRLAFLLWIVGVLIVWCAASLAAKKILPIDPSVITMIGILMTGKVVQSFSENFSPLTPPTPPTKP